MMKIVFAVAIVAATPALAQTLDLPGTVSPNDNGGYAIQQPNGAVSGYLTPYNGGFVIEELGKGGRQVRGYAIPLPDGGYRIDRLPGSQARPTR
jgi:hypothetical protein